MMQTIKIHSQEDLNKFLAGGRVIYKITHYPYPYTNSYEVSYDDGKISQIQEMDYSEQFIHLLIEAGHLEYDENTNTGRVLSSETSIASLLLVENITTQSNVLMKLNQSGISVDTILTNMRILKEFQEKVKRGEIIKVNTSFSNPHDDSNWDGE